jgi:hypothetical protein
MPRIFLTTGSSWTVPDDCTSATIEVIGGGAGGGGATGYGGGGGAYSKTNNVSLTPSSSVSYGIGAGGTGNNTATGGAAGDTWFGGSDFASSLCGAKGGASTASGGGAASSGIGDVKYDGGHGSSNGGGGGAAGPSGAGANASTGSGAQGGNGSGGVGGAGGFPAGAGSAGTEWDATHGSGGGGGSPSPFNLPGAAGGLYGGGGGRGGAGTSAGGNGAQGIIVITYSSVVLLDAGVGEFAVTGFAAGLEAPTEILQAGTGVFVVGGQAAGLKRPVVSVYESPTHGRANIVFSEAAQAILSGQRVGAAVAVKLELANETLNLWLGNGRVRSNDGQYWEGLGRFGGISGLEFGAKASTRPIAMTLSGLDARLAGMARSEYSGMQGRRVSVYALVFNQKMKCIDLPYLCMLATIENAGMRRSGDRFVLELNAKPIFNTKHMPALNLVTDADQQTRYPGDKIFDRAAYPHSLFWNQ